MVARKEPSRQLTDPNRELVPMRKMPRGRLPGTMNRLPMILRDAILVAAREVGQDKKGKDGLVGYLKNIALTDPKSYCTLLRAVLPLTITAKVDVDQNVVYRSAQEVRDELQRRGVPIDGVFTVIQGGKSEHPLPRRRETLRAVDPEDPDLIRT